MLGLHGGAGHAHQVVAQGFEVRLLPQPGAEDLLVVGPVRVHEPSSAGPDLTFCVLEGGTVVAQTGPSPRLSPALHVEALEPCILKVVGWEDFEVLVLRNPKVGVK